MYEWKQKWNEINLAFEKILSIKLEVNYVRLGNILKGRFIWFIFIMGSLFSVSERNGFVIALCCLAICCLNRSSFVLLYNAIESSVPGGVIQSFLSGELLSPSDSCEWLRLCFPSLDAASLSWSMNGALRFCGKTFSLSRNPFANGLLSIFSCVICKKDNEWINIQGLSPVFHLLITFLVSAIPVIVLSWFNLYIILICLKTE